MSVQPNPLSHPVLSCPEGNLISVRISIDPRSLEDLLECLAHVDFPINPQIFHGRPTSVEFPAYEPWLEGLKRTLNIYGFPATAISTSPMFEAISL
jgi:hypothetical protein